MRLRAQGGACACIKHHVVSNDITMIQKPCPVRVIGSSYRRCCQRTGCIKGTITPADADNPCLINESKRLKKNNIGFDSQEFAKQRNPICLIVTVHDIAFVPNHVPACIKPMMAICNAWVRKMEILAIALHSVITKKVSSKEIFGKACQRICFEGSSISANSKPAHHG